MPLPLVSIVCDVYNHERFLKDTFNGFLIQQVRFPIEILVHDDASTDDSARIIREFESKYNDIIRPVYETENQHDKQNLWSDIQFPRAKGKYIAICEGDDYWIDPLKLQKQVDYMETHPNCSMCFGNAIVHWEDNSKPDKVFSNLENRGYSGVEISNHWIVPTATVLFRKKVIECSLFKQYSTNRDIITGDLPLWLTCASEGSVHGFSDVFSVYRKVCTGFMLSMDTRRRLLMGNTRLELYKVFGTAYRYSCISSALTHYRLAYSLALKEQTVKLLLLCLWKLIYTRIKYPDVAYLHYRANLQKRKRET